MHCYERVRFKNASEKQRVAPVEQPGEIYERLLAVAVQPDKEETQPWIIQ